MTDQPLLSLVIPAFNEEQRILATLEKVFAYLSGQAFSWEVIIVDDGSADGTAVRVEQLLEARTTLLRNQRNRGKGYSVRRGVEAARGRFTLFSDADLATPIEEFDKFLPYLEQGADVVIGSRALKDSQILVAQPWHRRVMGRVFNVFVQVLAVRGIGDTQCGFKAYRSDLARELFAVQHVERFSFDVENLFVARLWGCRIVEVPVRWLDSPHSTIHPMRDSVQMFRDLLVIRWLALRGAYRKQGRRG